MRTKINFALHVCFASGSSSLARTKSYPRQVSHSSVIKIVSGPATCIFMSHGSHQQMGFNRKGTLRTVGPVTSADLVRAEAEWSSFSRIYGFSLCFGVEPWWLIISISSSWTIHVSAVSHFQVSCFQKLTEHTIVIYLLSISFFATMRHQEDSSVLHKCHGRRKSLRRGWQGKRPEESGYFKGVSETTSVSPLNTRQPAAARSNGRKKIRITMCSDLL